MTQREELIDLIIEHPEITDRVLSLLLEILKSKPLDPLNEKPSGQVPSEHP